MARATVRLKFWVRCPRPLDAVKLSGLVPRFVGVPASVAVPLPWSVNVMPAGSPPARTMEVTGGDDTAATVKELGTPITKVAALALVKIGKGSTVRTKACVAGVATPLPAVMVNG